MSKPVLTDDLKEQLSRDLDLLLSGRIWSMSAERSVKRRGRTAQWLAFLLFILAFICVAFIIQNAKHPAPDGTTMSALVIAFVLLLLLGIGSCVVTYLAYKEDRRGIYEDVLLFINGKLWCLSSRDNIEKTKERLTRHGERDRYSMIALRDAVSNNGATYVSLDNEKIKTFFGYASIIEDYEMGNTEAAEGFDVSLIEDIETISSVENGKDVPSNTHSSDDEATTTIVYTDAITDERRELTLDSYCWGDFIDWLGEQQAQHEDR